MPERPTRDCSACRSAQVSKPARLCEKCLALLPAHLKEYIEFKTEHHMDMRGLMTAACLAIRKRVRARKSKALTKKEQKRAEDLTREFTRCKNFEQLIRCLRLTKWATHLTEALREGLPEELQAGVEELARYYDREQKARESTRRSWWHYNRPSGRGTKRK